MIRIVEQGWSKVSGKSPERNRLNMEAEKETPPCDGLREKYARQKEQQMSGPFAGNE